MDGWLVAMERWMDEGDDPACGSNDPGHFLVIFIEKKKENLSRDFWLSTLFFFFVLWLGFFRCYLVGWLVGGGGERKERSIPPEWGKRRR